MGATSLENVTSAGRAGFSVSAPNTATDTANNIERPVRMAISLEWLHHSVVTLSHDQYSVSSLVGRPSACGGLAGRRRRTTHIAPLRRDRPGEGRRPAHMFAFCCFP